MLLAACCTGIAALGWAAGGIRLASLCAVVGLLAGLTIHLAGDRIVLGMVGAREIPVGEAPMLHATVEALARRALIVERKPRALRQRELAGVDRRLTSEHPQQRRLAGAVAAGDRHPVAPLKPERDAAQQRAACHVLS